MKAFALGVALVALMVATPALADDPIVVASQQVKWADVPDAQGIQMAVLMGDPTKPGPCVVRLKFAPGTVFPAHTHPVTENVTIISGTFGAGLGSKVDKEKVQQFETGTFVSMPANVPHFVVQGQEESVVQIEAMGPLQTVILGASQ